MPLNIDIQQILLHMLNFVILFAVMYFVLYKPVKAFIDKRDNYFREMEDKATRALDEATAAKDEYETKLRGADEEIKAMKAEAQKDSREDAEKIRSDARKEAKEILNTAKLKAEHDTEVMIKNANSEICELAQQAAEKFVVENTSDAYNSFIEAADIPDED